VSEATHTAYARMLRFHAFLLGGRERVEAYATALEATVRPGDRVLDVGAGTGVLGMLALRAGAAEVVAVEDTASLALAAEFAAANGLADRVKLVRRPTQQVRLEPRARLLVSDAYDSFGLQDGMLGSMIDARERLATGDATLVPSALSLHVAALEAPARYAEVVAPWAADLCGLDFSAGRTFAINGVQQAALEPGELLGPPAQLAHIDLTTAASAVVAGEVEVGVARDGVLHGLAGWFRAELAPGVEISNAPGEHTTPYLQAWLPIGAPVPVTAGERIRARVETDDGASWSWTVAVGDARFEHATDGCFPGLRG
jgi:protein arginine N-methyltransferase 1